MMKIVRSTFRNLHENVLSVTTADGQALSVVLTASQQRDLSELSFALQTGNVLNLLNLSADTQHPSCEFIIYEPDYLIDTSSLAECFKPYGHHPLNYTLARMQSRTMTAPILLGNTANFFIDEFVNATTEQSVEYVAALRKLFQTAAFEVTTCADLKNPKDEAAFFENCRRHFDNIRYAVQDFFPKAGIDKDKVVLEPSFISGALGLQGRLDIMLCDYSKFIELKSGKAVEDFRSGGAFIHSAENHYIQMILYLAILEFNLQLSPDHVASFLLYSKYPILSKESHSRKHLNMALSLRNQIVAREYLLHQRNDIATAQALLRGISAGNLNTGKLTGKLFEHYLAPSIDCFPKSFAMLHPLEQQYFLRLYAFVNKELWISKAGEREYEGVKKSSVLWNAPLEDKMIAGEILPDLTIADNQADTEQHTIRLAIPEYEDLYLPNFRQGDAVVLYERNATEDTVHNRQVFKGAIETMDMQFVTVRLRFRQKNPQVWNPSSRYALEHDYMDSTYTGMFRALNSFVTANEDRRALLLGAKGDIFLLLGPPGTGKTSISLKNKVEEALKKPNANILLLSYTNRAVDEICRALSSIRQDLPFIRIGSELNCAPEFRAALLENRLTHCIKRKDVAQVIADCRIFVGTVASVWNKPELFQLVHFDMAIIDEATQLLEPHLLGIFCAKNLSGYNAIDRFVLIGDHKQLPAVVLQSKVESAVHEPELNAIGLTDVSNSLFERLYRLYQTENRTENFSMLSKQGRMHPEIAAFPSKYFYENRLDCVGLAHQKEQLNDAKRLYFYNITPLRGERATKANLNEANQVVAICRDIYANCIVNHKAFQAQNIGIITPYRNQIALIRRQLQQTGIAEFSTITVDTVERFQGSQCDIIIYSFCVKTKSQLDALPNWTEDQGQLIDRKLNVALTRARRQLFIVGNKKLLEQNVLYKQLIAHIHQTEV
ncbi:MAG: AAA family ATPase [Candidatus Symbiothrix sp.]|nr:AAA family ATPase [Candidatus Symbiothrix sp.]